MFALFQRPDSQITRAQASHFQILDDSKAARQLFKESVEMVEIETHSYCNRLCWFCPNSFIDRRSERAYLDEEAYLTLLNDLRAIDYRNKISYSRYNEPFGDAVFYERLQQASKIVPHALLHTNTNGDYLNTDTLEKAYQSGLRSLHVQIYLKKDESFSKTLIAQKAETTQQKLPGVSFRLTRDKPDVILYKARYQDMAIRLYARDFTQNGTNRGGLEVREGFTTRYSPCTQPFYSLYIDHTGDVMPCCNLRSDYEPHRASSLGKIDSQSGALFRIFTGKKAVQWRRLLYSFEEKRSPCQDCSFRLMEATSTNRRALQKRRERFGV